MEQLKKVKNNRKNGLKIIYLIIVIILLILSIIISFKTGEGLYKLINTNTNSKSTETETGIADWSFIVKVY